MTSTDRFWPHAAAAGVVALAGQAALAVWIGLDLHLFFAGMLLATLLVPPLAAMAKRRNDPPLLSAAVTAGLALAWLLPPTRSIMTQSIESRLIAIVFAWTLALSAGSWLLARLFHEQTLGSATTVFLALAWLGAPIWLGNHAPAIVAVHPLFALNAVLIDLGFWTEQPIEYRYLFSLGQDVPYVMPTGVSGCVFLHVSLGIVLGVLAFCVDDWKS